MPLAYIRLNSAIGFYSITDSGGRINGRLFASQIWGLIIGKVCFRRGFLSEFYGISTAIISLQIVSTSLKPHTAQTEDWDKLIRIGEKISKDIYEHLYDCYLREVC